MHATEDALELAYGPFVPGSAARAIRVENAKHGYRTCWRCLEPFAPRRERRADGSLTRLGRGRWYCSRACADADRSTARAEPEPIDPDVLVIDLRRCRGCAA